MFSADEIRELLSDLGDRVAARHEHVDAYIVGGAAIAIILGSRRSTEDIDGLFSNVSLVLEIADEMAHERGIPQHWLNSRIEPFMPTGVSTADTEAESITLGGLTVRLASPRWLLAMKMAAGRLKDREDIVDLIRLLDIHSADEIVDWTFKVHGAESVILTDSHESVYWQAEEMLRLAWRDPGA
ncbi:DUF6036 family nucleotidyltransferase [Agromyces neolithicus]|uniref:DUF6036 family nucleotidyltransferase n=1 Tax=Agromyces neolithicus TaxID=269420 RepID=UPI0031DD9A54